MDDRDIFYKRFCRGKTARLCVNDIAGIHKKGYMIGISDNMDPFVKMKFFKKFLGFVLLLFVIKFLFILPAVNYAFEVDTCIDIGVCKEGIETKIDGQLIEINKENCLLHNKEWDDNINSCYVR